MEIKPFKLKCEMIFSPDDNDKNFNNKILFVCDKTKCPKAICEQSECYQTSDINYAKWFDLDE